MEEPTPEQQKTSTNDKGCQTDEICNGSPEPTGPDSGSTHPPECCVEPGDPPLLQKQIQTSRSGIQQIIECFRSGTTQLRHILLKEVDTIFECKLCRSLFRGLPNLITHKEFYCFPRDPQPDGSSREARQSTAMKELIEAIYPRKDEYVVRLEPIGTNQNAVFQHVAHEDRAASQAAAAEEKRKEKDKDKEKEPEQKHAAALLDGADPDVLESEAENQEETEEEEEEEEEEGEAEEEEEDEEEEEEELQGMEEEEEEEEEDGDEGTEDEGERRDSPGKGSDVDVDVSDSSDPVLQGVTITCCMCGKDFYSRQSIRRHCRKMHQNRLEELRKFTEMRTVPISLLSMVKVPTGASPVKTAFGKSCPVCCKSFATKANVRRHFDEVHRGLRRDLITPDIATKPGEPLSLESKPSPTTASAAATTAANPPQYNLASGKCLVCKRKYSSQARLKRHLRIVHKIRPKMAAAASGNSAQAASSSSSSSGKKAVKRSASPPPQAEVQRRGRPKKYKREEPYRPRKHQEEGSDEAGDASPTVRRPKLALGFDFKLLYCKLCKRQFSSRQNLDKHIELHTDNDNEIFIKFYRCPLCSYETRRKRDVLRHITVVHKKPGAYLSKIMATIESRAVKKPAELVLRNSGAVKRTQPSATAAAVKEEMNGRHEPSTAASTPQSSRKHADATAPSTPVTRRHDLPPPTPPVTRKHSLFHSSPPVTRKSDQHQHQHHAATTPHTRKQETPQSLTSAKQEPAESPHGSSGGSGSSSTEVKVTKNFSLHACDMCGRAFAKKLYLETHKRSHRNAAAAAASTNDDHRTLGVSTRSKALLW